MFENHLNGVFPSNFTNLVHLKHLHIFNDGRIIENERKYHINTIWLFDPDIMSGLIALEDVNLVHLDMIGYLNDKLITKWKHLRTLNLSNNRLEGQVPDIAAWANWERLEYLEIGDNNFTGMLP